jgi:sugar O-acyltransferase (sialic acid O-acetyltransferase NeuD family)
MSDMRRAPHAGTGHQIGSEARGERVVIVGAGVVGALALEYFAYDSPHEVVAFSAEREFITTETFCGLPVVPFDKLAMAYPPTEYQAFVAVAATPSVTVLNRVRRRLYGTVKDFGYSCVSYVSSRAAFISPTAQIGENTIVAEGNSLHHMARVGNNVVLLSGVHVGHRSVVEDDCFFGSQVAIAGDCRVGRGSFLGISSCVAFSITVAEDNLIGAGAVIIRDTAPRQVYSGNPARPIGGDNLAETTLSSSGHDVADEGPCSAMQDGAGEPSVATDVLRIFREICFLPPHAPVDTTQPFAVHAGWDSLRQIEFIVRLEKCFDVRLTETDLLHSTTVGAVISTLEAKRGQS